MATLLGNSIVSSIAHKEWVRERKLCLDIQHSRLNILVCLSESAWAKTYDPTERTKLSSIYLKQNWAKKQFQSHKLIFHVTQKSQRERPQKSSMGWSYSGNTWRNTWIYILKALNMTLIQEPPLFFSQIKFQELEKSRARKLRQWRSDGWAQDRLTWRPRLGTAQDLQF